MGCSSPAAAEQLAELTISHARQFSAACVLQLRQLIQLTRLLLEDVSHGKGDLELVELVSKVSTVNRFHCRNTYYLRPLDHFVGLAMIIEA